MEVVGDFEYNKRDLIGHGAFAVVFKGRYRKNPDLPVAIKSITKKNLAKSQALLQKEINILKELSGLQHENVVALLDCKETSQNLYLVMEYCNGGDLADYLHAKGTLSEDTISLFLKQIAGAMQALNAKDIVHRDLKPQNLLLCHSGRPNPPPSEIRLKIADFGFARFLQDGVMAGTLCGSPMYMAPEVIMSQQYCAKADLWSIGTIVYQCLTGRAPFQAQTPQQLKLFYERNLQLTPAIPSGTSPLLHDLLTRLLKRNPTDRIEFSDFFSHPFHNRSPPAITAPVPVPGSSSGRRSCAPDACDSGGSGASSPSLKAVSVSPLSGRAAGSIGFRAPPPPSLPIQHEPLLAATADDARQDAIGGRTSAKLAALSDPEGYVMVPDCPVSEEEYLVAAGRAAVEHRRRQQLAAVRPSSPAASSPPPTHETHKSRMSPSAASPSAQQHYPESAASAHLHDQRRGSGSSATAHGSSLPSTRGRSASSAAIGSGQSAPREIAAPSSAIVRMRRDSPSASAGDVASVTPPAAAQFTVGTPPVGGFHRRSGTMSSPPANLALARRSSIEDERLLYHVQTSPAALLTLASSPPRATFLTGGAELLRSPAGSSSGHLPTVAEHQQLRQLRTGFGTPPSSLGLQHPLSAMHSPVAGTAGTVVQYSSSVPAGTSLTGMPTSDTSGRMRHQSGSGRTPPAPPASTPSFLYPSPGQPPPIFAAPELAEETLMSDDHNQTLSKLQFVLTVVESIVDLAAIRNSPLSDSKLASKVAGCIVLMSEQQRRLEQLVLYVRALHILSSALQLAKDEVATARLHPTNAVKTVLREMNARFRSCLDMCKLLRSKGVNMTAGIDQEFLNSTADKLIYEHAIDLCRQAALDELFGNMKECLRRYKSAHVLLHTLAQMADLHSDQQLLTKYECEVEKRLYYLQNQCFVLT